MGFLFLSFLIISSPNCVYLEIEKGDRCEEVAKKLYESGVIKQPVLFAVWARITGNDKGIKAGRYKFETPCGVRDALRKIVKGETVDIKVTIPEGTNIFKVAEIFQSQTGIDSAEFMKLVKNSSLLNKFGIDAPTLEGFLFPDTYFAFDSILPERVIEMMVKRFFELFDSTLWRRMDSLGFTLNEIVTLASLIQSEAKVKEEMSIISSVYYNRLANGRKLESCPTILYILPERKNRLLYMDLTVDSPYNTYTHPGLPPGAICNPGKDAILAALYPAKTNYLYFVAKGDGTHIFSKTHKEHIAAKRSVDADSCN
ncbi:MAG: endolytic transglycosylase MltG [bacterium]|nr:endolytic transglycosylase MltG [bacterium]